jgi:hypothetical protein
MKAMEAEKAEKAMKAKQDRVKPSDWAAQLFAPPEPGDDSDDDCPYEMVSSDDESDDDCPYEMVSSDDEF